VKLLGLEAGRHGLRPRQNAASIAYGRPGVLQGCYSLLPAGPARPDPGDALRVAGLDYPGVGPEHALLASIGRVTYEGAEDDESLEALAECCQAEASCRRSRARTPSAGASASRARTRAAAS